ncbi:MAG TPA: single-stranded-DNA-specific exonuclease C-terminal domain-containing protein, partial [Bacilli bacterium]
ALKKVYAALKQLRQFCLDKPGAVDMISSRTGLSAAMVRASVEIFEELVFIEREGDMLSVVPKPRKRNLTDSAKYRRMMEQTEAEKVLIYSTAAELTVRLKELAQASNCNMKTEELA